MQRYEKNRFWIGTMRTFGFVLFGTLCE